MCFSLSRYALFLCVSILLHYHYACANNLALLNILNATPEKYARHFTGQVCLHIVSQMFLRIVVNLALYALSDKIRKLVSFEVIPHLCYSFSRKRKTTTKKGDRNEGYHL